MEPEINTIHGRGLLSFRPNPALFAANAALGEDAPVSEREFGVSVDAMDMMRSNTEIGKFLAPRMTGSTRTLGFPECGVEDDRGLLYGLEADVRKIVAIAEAEGALVVGDLCWFNDAAGEMVSVMFNDIEVSSGQVVVRFDNGKIVEV